MKKENKFDLADSLLNETNVEFVENSKRKQKKEEKVIVYMTKEQFSMLKKLRKKKTEDSLDTLNMSVFVREEIIEKYIEENEHLIK